MFVSRLWLYSAILSNLACLSYALTSAKNGGQSISSYRGEIPRRNQVESEHSYAKPAMAGSPPAGMYANESFGIVVKIKGIDNCTFTFNAFKLTLPYSSMALDEAEGTFKCYIPNGDEEVHSLGRALRNKIGLKWREPLKPFHVRLCHSVEDGRTWMEFPSGPVPLKRRKPLPSLGSGAGQSQQLQQRSERSDVSRAEAVAGFPPAGMYANESFGVVVKIKGIDNCTFTFNAFKLTLPYSSMVLDEAEGTFKCYIPNGDKKVHHLGRALRNKIGLCCRDLLKPSHVRLCHSVEDGRTWMEFPSGPVPLKRRKPLPSLGSGGGESQQPPDVKFRATGKEVARTVRPRSPSQTDLEDRKRVKRALDDSRETVLGRAEMKEPPRQRSGGTEIPRDITGHGSVHRPELRYTGYATGNPLDILAIAALSTPADPCRKLQGRPLTRPGDSGSAHPGTVCWGYCVAGASKSCTETPRCAYGCTFYKTCRYQHWPGGGGRSRSRRKHSLKATRTRSCQDETRWRPTLTGNAIYSNSSRAHGCSYRYSHDEVVLAMFKNGAS
ncbi:hypothetical protein FOZ63_026716 [Perkinsus olseni]|uniref:Uncharacterized protein n=1 Tax=Perkinsus olseni TaxID=32597 RepID=A0A7J6Q9A2_PEROL|nr:hypothetical protein FOZ62_029660 [Perkinsus olseni]KAF4704772.1 hypothetical protein FOZ63_026716 [Perkinsus olseni]